MLKGNVISLRAVEREDLALLLAWRNKPEFRRLFREFREISMVQQIMWFENTVLDDPATRMFSVIETTGGRLLGATGLCYIHPIDRSADLSIYIGADDLYIDDIF